MICNDNMNWTGNYYYPTWVYPYWREWDSAPWLVPYTQPYCPNCSPRYCPCCGRRLAIQKWTITWGSTNDLSAGTTNFDSGDYICTCSGGENGGTKG